MFKYNVRNLLLNQGASNDIELTETLKSINNGMDDITLCEDVVLKGSLQDVGNQIIYFEGNIKTIIELPCSRCTVKVRIPLDIHVHQKYSQNIQDEDEDMESIEGNMIDLYPLVINAIKLNIPMKVLCSSDCKGLCNICGINLNKHKCDCESTDIDPRLEVLKDFFSNE